MPTPADLPTMAELDLITRRQQPSAYSSPRTLGLLIDPSTSPVAVAIAAARASTPLIRRGDGGVLLLPDRRANMDTLGRVVVALHHVGVPVHRVTDLPSLPGSELHSTAAACNAALTALRTGRQPPAALEHLGAGRLYRMLRESAEAHARSTEQRPQPMSTRQPTRAVLAPSSAAELRPSDPGTQESP